jgi:hypothetical protein
MRMRGGFPIICPKKGIEQENPLARVPTKVCRWGLWIQSITSITFDYRWNGTAPAGIGRLDLAAEQLGEYESWIVVFWWRMTTLAG